MAPLTTVEPPAASSPPAVRPESDEDRGRRGGPPRAPDVEPPGETYSERLFLVRQDEHSRLFWVMCLALSIALHAALFTLRLPSFDLGRLDVTKTRDVMFVRRYVPPPPKTSAPGSPIGGPVVPLPVTRRLPVPDPTPMEPEPIIAARLEAPEAPLPLGDDVVVLLGDPEPPPPARAGPLYPGIGGVTEPVLLARVEPEYPEVARRARMQGRVILQAVIHKDGTVRKLTVLEERPPHLGFKEAAVAAVTQWRYLPATQRGRPVDVYFTVVVNFTLL
ncbi:MAG: TonB family protein [Acidobacteriota bacterium]|nr:TonB family protein [Acidobacteriota bacterium]